ncbi:hypothetical protein AAIH29_30490, partial [Pseudomonas aeruginosa]
MPATMISFWNAPPGSPSADLRTFVELACALGGEGFPAALLETLGHWVAARHFSVLRIGAPRPPKKALDFYVSTLKRYG